MPELAVVPQSTITEDEMLGVVSQYIIERLRAQGEDTSYLLFKGCCELTCREPSLHRYFMAHYGDRTTRDRHGRIRFAKGIKEFPIADALHRIIDQLEPIFLDGQPAWKLRARDSRGRLMMSIRELLCSRIDPRSTIFDERVAKWRRMLAAASFEIEGRRRRRPQQVTVVEQPAPQRGDTIPALVTELRNIVDRLASLCGA